MSLYGKNAIYTINMPNVNIFKRETVTQQTFLNLLRSYNVYYIITPAVCVYFVYSICKDEITKCKL